MFNFLYICRILAQYVLQVQPLRIRHHVAKKMRQIWEMANGQCFVTSTNQVIGDDCAMVMANDPMIEQSSDSLSEAIKVAWQFLLEVGR